MRKLISSILITQTIAAQSFAGYVDDARRYVADSKETAQKISQIIFNEHIRMAYERTMILQSQNQDQLSELQSYKDLHREFKKSLAQIDPVRSQQMTTDLVEQVTDKLSEAYRQASVRQQQMQILEARAASVASKMRESNDYFIASMQEVCEQGVAEDVRLPNLPPVTPIVPSYEIEATVTIPFEGGETEFGANATANHPDYEAASMASTLATAGSSYFLSTAASMGVGVAVAAVVAISAHINAIKESNKIADAAEDVFWNTATSEDVVENYRKICTPIVAKLIEAQQTAKDILSGNENVLAKHQKSQELAKEIYADYQNLSIEVAKIKLSIEERLKVSVEEDKLEAEVKKELAETPEYKNYIVLEEKIADTMPELLVGVIVETYVNSEKLSDKVVKLESDKQYEKLKDVSSLITKLRYANHLQKIELQRRGTLELMRREIQANKELGKLYKSFDLAIGEYIYAQLVIGETSKEIATLKSVKAKFLELKRINPYSRVLKKFETRFKTYTNALGLRI